MKKESTKQKILTEAVKLFSRDGYEAVTVEQIATAVGIKAPSLYKHYKNKRDIFDRILERMNQMDYDRARAFDMPEGTMAEMAERYARTPLEKIKIYSEAQFLHWTEEEFPTAFRKVLTIEQYRSKEMSTLYHQYLGGGPTAYMADLFSQITRDEGNGMQLALEFYAPMSLLYSMYDAAESAAEKRQITGLLRAHIERFAARIERDYNLS